MPKKPCKDTYFAKAAKKNREKRKAEEIALRERNTYLEECMPKLKRKHDRLLEEYNLLQENDVVPVTELNLKEEKNALLKDEVAYFRAHRNRILDLMLNLRQEAKLQGNIFQVRRNYYQLLSSVSKLSHKISKEPRVSSSISFTFNGVNTKLRFDMFFEEIRLNGRLKRTMTIDINQIPINCTRLAHLWRVLQEDRNFMRTLGKRLSGSKSFGKIFSETCGEEFKPILSNNEFTLMSGIHNKKSYFLSGIHKNKAETTLVKTFLSDFTRSLEDLHEENPAVFKAAIFKKAAVKDTSNLSVFFCYEDPPCPVDNEFSKDAFLAFIRHMNAPDKNVNFVQSLLKQCLISAS